MKYGVNMGYMDETVPVDKLREDQKDVTMLTSDQLKQFLNECKKNDNAYFFACFMVFTGIRPREMFALDWNDINPWCHLTYFDQPYNGLVYQVTTTRYGNHGMDWVSSVFHSSTSTGGLSLSNL